MHSINRIIAYLPALLAAVLLCLSTGVSQAGPLSPSVVLVLKLVAADRVQPVTGIVVADEGLVLVPADFVAADAEIVVLDGGTDILGNGRPAVLFKQLPETGLALLSVAGLKRPAIAIAASTGDDESLYLEAFPPAQQIAEGAEPLQLELAPQAPLPYVSGAILDACGLLSAVAVASGKQSLDSGQQPLIIDNEALVAAFAAFQLDVPRAACRVVHTQAEENSVEIPPVVPEAETTVPVANTPVEETVGGQAAEQGEATTEAGTIEQPAPVEAPAVVVQPPARAPSSQVIPWWAQLAGLLVLALLAWVIFRARRQHKVAVDPASAEPDTVQLTHADREPAPRPRSGRDGDEVPNFTDLPAACNGFVVLRDAAAGLHYSHPVDVQHFDLVIGRGESDIRIEHGAISRRHARLVCRDGAMTITDLDSANGLHVKRVPCLPGEVMHLEPGSEICFGDLCLSLEVLQREPLL